MMIMFQVVDQASGTDSKTASPQSNTVSPQSAMVLIISVYHGRSLQGAMWHRKVVISDSESQALTLIMYMFSVL